MITDNWALCPSVFVVLWNGLTSKPKVERVCVYVCVVKLASETQLFWRVFCIFFFSLFFFLERRAHQKQVTVSTRGGIARFAPMKIDPSRANGTAWLSAPVCHSLHYIRRWSAIVPVGPASIHITLLLLLLPVNHNIVSVFKQSSCSAFCGLLYSGLL